jgi:2-polyprenyl-3-methyl-5-hydroxy-6-metoxy-1,4-benzoquinol methylase
MAEPLTDQRYWDAVWTFTDDHTKVAPAIHTDHDTHQAWLDRQLGRRLTSGTRFLEVGAGGSAWPAHVARHYGAEAWGIDFSRPGLELAALAATRQRVQVRLVEGDLFDPRALPDRGFDVVYSGGFVEHFPDAEPVMARLAALLRPGGVVVTAVPNLAGLNGLLQRVVDADCWARHVVFTPTRLDRAHALGGLRPVVPARHLGVCDLGAVNFSRLASRLPPPALRVLWAGLSLARRTTEAVAARLGRDDGGWILAPGIVGVYERAWCRESKIR